ncbi:MAG: hypothetical protein ACI9EA_000967 [Pseudomonadales bacterium]
MVTKIGVRLDFSKMITPQIYESFYSLTNYLKS